MMRSHSNTPPQAKVMEFPILSLASSSQNDFEFTVFIEYLPLIFGLDPGLAVIISNCSTTRYQEQMLAKCLTKCYREHLLFNTIDRYSK